MDVGQATDRCVRGTPSRLVGVIGFTTTFTGANVGYSNSISSDATYANRRINKSEGGSVVDIRDLGLRVARIKILSTF